MRVRIDHTRAQGAARQRQQVSESCTPSSLDVRTHQLCLGRVTVDVIELHRVFVPDLLLDVHQRMKQRLGSRWAPGDIHVNRQKIVDSLDNAIAAMHTARRRARAHGDAPLWIRHLVPNATQGVRHLEGTPSCYKQKIGLTRRKAKRFASETAHVKAGAESRHHFDTAAGESHRERHERVRSSPVKQDIEPRRQRRQPAGRLMSSHAGVRRRLSN